ncbi:glycosyl transferase group 1 [Desulfonatronospira thiodismutans ASO3-1]|uniref:Glycosyl transferase group 1 n=1 Tax=Desulfonatronospira thiodismutans ASO3-1 TaxID=555779 RepID=D6SKU7_9BACT|nr:glycosyltransferase family 4 protein [Desulfonatronospira thiodismutans]EFI35308.1 glycosyl transferase group 1 [Desulfonatronospira thiodismutans ASO3-1]
MKRILYLKAGNAVQEYKVLIDSGLNKAGGSESFLADFLKLVGDNPSLVISLHTVDNHDQKIVGKTLSIHSYSRLAWDWFVAGKRAGRFLRLIKNSCLIFIRVLRFKPDAVLCWSGSLPCWACFVGARLTKSKFIFSRHITFTTDDMSKLKRFMGVMDRLILNRADAVIAHGPFLLEESIKDGVPPERITMFDCVFDEKSVWYKKKLYPGSSIRTMLSTKRFNILYVGRIEAAKGIFDLLTAFTGIMEKHSRTMLYYVGDGNHLPALKKEISSRRMNSRAKCLGRIAHDRLPKLMNIGHCLVVPTRIEYPEGRCMAAMEGLIAGLPVVAPDFGPFPYLIKDRGNGLLFKPDSPKSLKDCLTRLLEDKDLYGQIRLGAAESGRKLLENRNGYFITLKKIIG